MTVSCIIPSLRRPQALEKTLRSLQAQSCRADEVFVVLQGDTPPPPEDLLKSSNTTILRQAEPNAQRARNAAALRAGGELLLFLDDDIEAAPDLIEAFRRAFEDPRLGAACGCILDPGQEPTREVPAHVSVSPMGWMRFPLNYGGNATTQNFSSCNTCVRHAVHFESGGFDGNYVVTIHDDSDWSIRLCGVLRRNGMEGRHLGAAVLTHFRERSGGRRVARASAYVKIDAESWASRLYFWRKNYGWRAGREFMKYVRWDLLCGSLLVRPPELALAWNEFLKGWRIASRRLVRGPVLLGATGE